MRRLLLLALFAFTAACGQPANLDPLLIQAGDLPGGMTAGQISDTMPPIFDKLPQPTRFIRQEFVRGDQPGGAVSVLIYDQAADRDAAYASIVADMPPGAALPNVGERATFGYIAVRTQIYDLVFQRCKAVVHMRMSAPRLSADNLEAYAKRLDSRLRPVVC